MVQWQGNKQVGLSPGQTAGRVNGTYTVRPAGQDVNTVYSPGVGSSSTVIEGGASGTGSKDTTTIRRDQYGNVIQVSKHSGSGALIFERNVTPYGGYVESGLPGEVRDQVKAIEIQRLNMPQYREMAEQSKLYNPNIVVNQPTIPAGYVPYTTIEGTTLYIDKNQPQNRKYVPGMGWFVPRTSEPSVENIPELRSLKTGSRTEDMFTYPIYSGSKFIRDKLYNIASDIEKPTGKTGSLIKNASPYIIRSVGNVVEFGGMVPAGTERLIRNPKLIVPSIGAGIAMQVGGIAEQAQKNPVQLVSDVAVFSVASYGIGKGTNTLYAASKNIKAPELKTFIGDETARAGVATRIKTNINPIRTAEDLGYHEVATVGKTAVDNINKPTQTSSIWDAEATKIKNNPSQASFTQPKKNPVLSEYQMNQIKMAELKKLAIERIVNKPRAEISRSEWIEADARLNEWIKRGTEYSQQPKPTVFKLPLSSFDVNIEATAIKPKIITQTPITEIRNPVTLLKIIPLINPLASQKENVATKSITKPNISISYDQKPQVSTLLRLVTINQTSFKPALNFGTSPQLSPAIATSFKPATQQATKTQFKEVKPIRTFGGSDSLDNQLKIPRFKTNTKFTELKFKRKGKSTLGKFPELARVATPRQVIGFKFSKRFKL